MNIGEITIILVIVIAGIGTAIPLAKNLTKIYSDRKNLFRYFKILILIYFLECIALVLGMGIPVLNVCLAFIWGPLFGMRLGYRAPKSIVLRSTLFLSLYSSLPSASFIFIPIMSLIVGWNILSAEDGYRFGIPNFLKISWPFNTILGFYLLLVMLAVLLKTITTVSGAWYLIHRGRKLKT